MFYKLINESQNVKYDNSENDISNQDESSDESINNLLEVQPQKLQERNNFNEQFIESMQQYEKEVNDDACSISPGNIIENDEEMSKGEKTPVKGSTFSIIFMQQKLNKALQILSPAEKMENRRLLISKCKKPIKNKAKLNPPQMKDQ